MLYLCGKMNRLDLLERVLGVPTATYHEDYMVEFISNWLKENNYDWEDPKLSLGYIKIGQVDLQRTFGTGASIHDIHETMNSNLNITSIRTITGPSIETDYPYTLDSDDWKQIQMEGLKQGYESRSMR